MRGTRNEKRGTGINAGNEERNRCGNEERNAGTRNTGTNNGIDAGNEERNRHTERGTKQTQGTTKRNTCGERGTEQKLGTRNGAQERITGIDAGNEEQNRCKERGTKQMQGTRNGTDEELPGTEQTQGTRNEGNEEGNRCKEQGTKQTQGTTNRNTCRKRNPKRNLGTERSPWNAQPDSKKLRKARSKNFHMKPVPVQIHVYGKWRVLRVLEKGFQTRQEHETLGSEPSLANVQE
nr:uncharacterized protein DDB_G0290685-like [Penaeus vannamei]